MLQVNEAANLFKQAGCVHTDIKAALSSHIKHDEIDIPLDLPTETDKVLPFDLLCLLSFDAHCVSHAVAVLFVAFAAFALHYVIDNMCLCN